MTEPRTLNQFLHSLRAENIPTYSVNTQRIKWLMSQLPKPALAKMIVARINRHPRIDADHVKQLALEELAVRTTCSLGWDTEAKHNHY